MIHPLIRFGRSLLSLCDIKQDSAVAPGGSLPPTKACPCHCIPGQKSPQGSRSPNVEPGNEEVIEAFKAWGACESKLVVKSKRLGLNRNTHAAVFRAFELRADVFLHLEDDTVPSPDALRYFDWAVREVPARDEWHFILLGSGCNKPKAKPSPDQSHTCDSRPICSTGAFGIASASPARLEPSIDERGRTYFRS